MKKILCVLFAVFVLAGWGCDARASDIADVIIFEYAGKRYYYKDIENLERVLQNIVATDPCLKEQGVSAERLMGTLISICRQRRGNLYDILNKEYGHESKVQPTLGSWGVDNQYDRRTKSDAEVLQACIVDVDGLANELKSLRRHELVLGIGTDLDACINSIKVDLTAYNSQVCPTNISVESESKLANIRNLNRDFANKKFTFMDVFLPGQAPSNYVEIVRYEGGNKLSANRNDYNNAFVAESTAVRRNLIVVDHEMQLKQEVNNQRIAEREFTSEMNVNTVLVYNGDILVACQGGRAVQMGRPVFSGFVGCRGSDSQDVAGYGELPNGVYLLNAADKELMPSEKRVAWGKYRIPLLPSNESNTFGRNNFYLHGTDDPKKNRSGGCISLGTQIDEFVETDWFGRQKYMLVIVKSQL